MPFEQGGFGRKILDRFFGGEGGSVAQKLFGIDPAAIRENALGNLDNKLGFRPGGNLGFGAKSGRTADAFKETLKQVTPQFLQQSPVGSLTQNLLIDLFGDDFVDQQLLNQDLSLIGQEAAGTRRRQAGKARFRGSGVGEAITEGAGQAVEAGRSRRLAEEEARRFQKGLALTQAATSAFTNPLLTALGLGTQLGAGREGIDFARSNQPSDLEKGIGAVTGLVDAFF